MARGTASSRKLEVLPDEPEPPVGSYFVSAYPPFSCWRAEAVPAFRGRLEEAPGAAGELGLGLYVHVPFCVKRCDYCYYLCYDDRGAEIDRYLEAMLREIELYAAAPALAARPVTFAYVGGGTPTMLTAPQLDRLLGGLRHRLCWAPSEVTVECAPKTVTAAKLAVLREHGVTRVSLGVQQLDDRVLELNRRIHRVADVERAWTAIRRTGFPVVNVDLIAGLLGETDRSFFDSLGRVLELEPECVTIYLLEIPHNTPLFRALGNGRLTAPLPDWSAKRARLEGGFARLEAAGYVVRSGYAAVRDPARHPFAYQDAQYRGADLLGVGVSSFSYLDGIHQQNLAELGSYLDSLEAGRLPLGRAYALSPRERLVRELVLQLKLGELDVRALGAKFGVDVTEAFAAPLARLAARGWATVDGAAIRLTRAGLLRVDRLLPDFYLPPHRGVAYS